MPVFQNFGEEGKFSKYFSCVLLVRQWFTTRVVILSSLGTVQSDPFFRRCSRKSNIFRLKFRVWLLLSFATSIQATIANDTWQQLLLFLPSPGTKDKKTWKSLQPPFLLSLVLQPSVMPSLLYRRLRGQLSALSTPTAIWIPSDNRFLSWNPPRRKKLQMRKPTSTSNAKRCLPFS